MVALHTTPATDHKSINQGNGVFVGHGHSKLFNEVLRYLTEDFGIEARYFENCSISGEQVIPSLQRMLDECGFAVIVATAEDESEDGIRARQNVVHETGLFQGRLGFERVAILKQVGVAHYSNLSGLLDIPFLGEGIDATFHKLGKQLRKFGYKQI
ncbi:MAG: nucleotide-binding protein [Fimbriimonas sp.]|nr:nucleotide-binding protein [Fimbriimonas sp.]